MIMKQILTEMSDTTYSSTPILKSIYSTHIHPLGIFIAQFFKTLYQFDPLQTHNVMQSAKIPL